MSATATDQDLQAAIKFHLRSRHRISLDYLAMLCGLTTRALAVALKDRSMVHWMCKRGWTFATSKALGLPPLELNPYYVKYLVRFPS